MKNSRLMLKLLNRNLDDQVKVVKEKQAILESLIKAKQRLVQQLEDEFLFIESYGEIRNFNFSGFVNYNKSTQEKIQIEIVKADAEYEAQKEILQEIFIQIKQIEIIDKKARKKEEYILEKKEQARLDDIAMRLYMDEDHANSDNNRV